MKVLDKMRILISIVMILVANACGMIPNGSSSTGSSSSTDSLLGGTVDQTQIGKGMNLYELHCASCHSNIENSDVSGVSSASIQHAIDRNFGGMGFLSDLSSEEIAMIAAALNPDTQLGSGNASNPQINDNGSDDDGDDSYEDDDSEEIDDD